MTQKERYEKSVKENARRHYKQEYEHLSLRTSIFVHKTYAIFKEMGFTDEQLRYLYARRY